jgi:hypothetical protein
LPVASPEPCGLRLRKARSRQTGAPICSERPSTLESHVRSHSPFGILLGPDFLRLDPPWPVDLDSHFRFLSGVFLGVGLGFYSCIPAIETKTERARLLGGLIVLGGLARLYSLAVYGAPSAGHLFGLGMELVVVPLLLLWQTRLAQAASGRVWA